MVPAPTIFWINTRPIRLSLSDRNLKRWDGARKLMKWILVLSQSSESESTEVVLAVLLQTGVQCLVSEFKTLTTQDNRTRDILRYLDSWVRENTSRRT